MMAEYQIRTCSVDDAAGIGQNNVTAFWEETFWRLLWVPEKTREEVIDMVAHRTPKNLLTERQTRRHQVVVHVPTGDIVGYCRWFLPESCKGEWLEAQVPNVDDEDAQRFAEQYAGVNFNYRTDMDVMDDPVNAMKAKHTPKAPYIELNHLACHPDHQRKGIASALIVRGINQADRLGLEIMALAAGERSLTLYKKLGFEVVDGVIQSLKPYGAPSDSDVSSMHIVIKRCTSGATSANPAE